MGYVASSVVFEANAKDDGEVFQASEGGYNEDIVPLSQLPGENMTTATASPPATRVSLGRGYFWAGLGACVFGLGLAYVQFALKHLAVPWYSPTLATIGALLLLVSVARRFTIARVLALVLVASFAGLQWFILGSLMKLPAYEGPARAGTSFPAFASSYADGRPFTDADLRDGSRRVMVFFRGRW